MRPPVEGERQVGIAAEVQTTFEQGHGATELPLLEVQPSETTVGLC
jgi:hypothetical protein